MIIVSGHLLVEPSTRDRYLETCREVVALGRAAAGSLDFSISADLVDDRRVNVVEVWADAESLSAFRGEGIEEEQQSMLLDVAVQEYDASPR